MIGSMSLNEVIVRHLVEQDGENAEKKSSNTKCYAVDRPNRYEASQDSYKVVEVTTLDLIFDD